MRIDKWLKVSRLIKRRETAKRLCADGDVLINGKSAKAMSEVKIGDELVLKIGDRQISAKVLQIREFANKDQAYAMYEIIGDSSFL